MFEILVTSSLLILVLALLRKLWNDRFSPIFSYMLWLIVAVRLLVPIPVFGNMFSVMNVVNSMVRGAEKWVESREGGDNVENPVFRQEADSQTGLAVMPEDAGAFGLLAEEVQADSKAGTAERKEAASGTVSETFQIERSIRGEAVFREFSEEEFTAVKLVRYLWYAGIVVMAAGMLAFNGLFCHRLYRERKFLYKEGRLRVYLAENLDSPCLYGVFCPAVYLTLDCLLSEQCREHATAHELTHYRHGDHIWILVRSLCAVLYWFDPLVWLAVYLSARDCELACDAGTVRRLGEEQREAYGCTLIRMASMSSSRLRILRCATGLSCGKKEMRERITLIAKGKKKTGIMMALPLLCAVLLAACTFGGAKETVDRGGYKETIVELPVSKAFADFVQGEEGMRLVDRDGKDYLSTDNGESFAQAAYISAADRRLTGSVYRLKGGADGSRMILEYGNGWQWILVNAAGEIVELAAPSGTDNFYPQFSYGAGSFYMWNENSVYWVDSVSGDVSLLRESTEYPLYLAADEKLLYVVEPEGMVLYDLEKEETAVRQDEVLSNFAGGRKDILLYPCETGVYIAMHEGLYWHELYGDTVECLIDGEMCGLGNRDRELMGMAVVETEEKESFLVYCSDGTLLRYDYDEEYTPVQAVLRVYSVYEDSNIRRAITMFQTKYPDIPIKYEVGISSGYGKTLDDALKNLSTELAAGNGPDILVMDDIPYSSYLQKGVLANLDSVRQQMTEETHFTSIIDAIASASSDMEASGSGEGLYMMPLTFVVPMLAGDAEATAGVQSLTELADLLEAAGAESGGSVLGTVNAREILSLLAQSSMGAWVPVDGTIDREVLTEFISQAKRIYEVQMRGVSEELLERVVVSGNEEETILVRRFAESGIGEIHHSALNKFAFFPEQPYYAGYLGEGYALFNGYLQIDGTEYCLMPGQKYGACIPISLAAVNNASEAKEESLLFLEYAISEEFQSEAVLKGLPINRSAYLKKQENPEEAESRNMPYTTFNISGKSGWESYEVYWPDEAAFGKLDRMIESIQEVNLCEDRVYEEVMRQGEKALTGSLSVEEAVDAVESALLLYLAE